MTPLANSKSEQVPFKATQTAIRISQLGIPYNSPLFFPLTVGNYTLGGGGLVSKLSEEVREKNGLTYGVYSLFVPLKETGPFLVSLSTKNAQSSQALQLSESVVNAFIKEGPNAKELEKAKRYLTGSFPMRLSSNRKLLEVASRMGAYHLPENYLSTYLAKIQAVSIDDIKQAFQSVLNDHPRLVITVGQQQNG